MTVFETIIIAIVEGITEFLPISSTGHMAITSAIMGINKEPFTKLFEIVIQLGAILSVVVLYWRKFFDFKKVSFYIKLIIAIIPALAFGYFLKDHIEKIMEKPVIIAVIMLAGGLVLLFVDKWFKYSDTDSEEAISNKQAFVIGLYQVLSIVLPGLSRSAATIIGGMQQKLTRNVAAEFSFFLAVPTMAAATGYKLLKGRELIMEHPENLKLLLIGNVVAFVVAMLAIKFFIDSLKKYGFKVWGYYRILVGIAILIAIAMGYKLTV